MEAEEFTEDSPVEFLRDGTQFSAEPPEED